MQNSPGKSLPGFEGQKGRANFYPPGQRVCSCGRQEQMRGFYRRLRARSAFHDIAHRIGSIKLGLMECKYLKFETALKDDNT